MLLKSAVSSRNTKMKFHPEKNWKNTLIHQLNHFEIHSDMYTLSSQTSFYAKFHAEKKTVRDLHYANNSRQGETHGISENQSFSNFKHPSDSSFGSAVLVLCT